MKYVAFLAGVALVAGLAGPAHADKTFGQFLQRTPSARLFQYVKKDSGATKKAELHTTGTATGNSTASIPVYYIFSETGLPVDLDGLQNAHLTVDFISDLGTTGTGNDRMQLFDTVTSGTISILRDTAAAEGSGSRTNLLTVSFSDAQLDASQNSGSFTFQSNVGSVINYSSDFLDLSNFVNEDFSFSFSGASPTFNSVLGSSGRTTRFSGTGTFAAEPVPEVSTWAMMVAGFAAAGVMMRTGRRRLALAA